MINDIYNEKPIAINSDQGFKQLVFDLDSNKTLYEHIKSVEELISKMKSNADSVYFAFYNGNVEFPKFNIMYLINYIDGIINEYNYTDAYLLIRGILPSSPHWLLNTSFKKIYISKACDSKHIQTNTYIEILGEKALLI